ncbi:hypothetical protein B0I32_111355 [Nonomuraea fuscirosea]|uniref:Uncharacterized protein n=1 Tax=Nonomuraea fuscirosea TaxID=1291556 RepID=A0A2T0MWN5_9ACTN|nr:hypothetical protein [Nonomuraea fuscirosea]PRX63359.1 hypothetical protein B0I32_111355 [Nonomuraea fuscirosea]
MIPEGHELGQGARAALAGLALGVTALIIYGLFSSGFGRPPRLALPTPRPAPALPPEPAPASDPAPASEPVAGPASGVASGASAPGPAATGPGSERPAAAGAVGPRPVRALAVVSGDLWLTHLPSDLERAAGGVLARRPGVESGAWARFGGAGRFVEVQVERGTVAAGWDRYRTRVAVRAARAVTVRGRPALVGRHPAGGRVIVWLERPGMGAWVRVSDSLSDDLLAIAASVQARVGD